MFPTALRIKNTSVLCRIPIDFNRVYLGKLPRQKKRNKNGSLAGQLAGFLSCVFGTCRGKNRPKSKRLVGDKTTS